MEEPTVHRLALQVPHRSGVRVRQDGFSAVLSNDCVQAGSDVGQRFVPAHGLEFPASLWPHPAQRMRQPVVVVRPLEVAIYLRAEKALSDRMVRVTVNPHCLSMLHRGDDGAGIRTVVWTGTADGATGDQGERRAHGS